MRPLVAITPTGIAITGNIECSPRLALKYTIVCTLLLTPSLAVAAIWKRINWRVRLLIVTLFTAFMLPAINVIAPVCQCRVYNTANYTNTIYYCRLSRARQKISSSHSNDHCNPELSIPFTGSGYVHLTINVNTIYWRLPLEKGAFTEKHDRIRKHCKNN